MVGVFRGVQEETIVVLDDHDGPFEASIFQGFDPLIGIQMLWIEIIRVFLPIPPLTIVVGVHPKVDEGCQFFAVVLYLGLAWKGTVVCNLRFLI